MKKILIFIFCFYTNSVFCFNFPKEKYRPLIEKYLSEKTANKLLGKLTPTIPTITKNRKEFKSFRDKKRNKELSSKENSKYNYSFLSEMFFLLKERKPLASEVNSWMNVFDQDGTREGVYRALVLDGEYRKKEFNKNSNTSENLAMFCSWFLKKYLGSDISREKLEKNNEYTVKRSIAEKSLDLIDAFDNDEDLILWYALLSKDLAEKYENVFFSSLRKNNSRKKHTAWANEVSTQDIKSEVLIKLYKVMNSLL